MPFSPGSARPTRSASSRPRLRRSRQHTGTLVSSRTPSATGASHALESRPAALRRRWRTRDSPRRERPSVLLPRRGGRAARWRRRLERHHHHRYSLRPPLEPDPDEDAGAGAYRLVEGTASVTTSGTHGGCSCRVRLIGGPTRRRTTLILSVDSGSSQRTMNSSSP